MGTGGVRYGAGRPGWRRKCEHCLRLDVRLLRARNLLRAGIWFSWGWSWNGERSSEVGITMRADAMEVRYIWTPNDDEPRDICCIVPLERTPCRYGGTRTWFRCPDCGRRCALVYGLNRWGHFACRRCLNLAYQSEAEDVTGRAWRKQRRLEALLDEHGNRPKRMRWRTYERICERIDECEAVRDAALLPQMLRLLGRLERR